jgi:hypothetical protein
MMFGLIGALIIVLRCFQWLKTGVWETFTLHNVLEWCIGRIISIDKFDSGFRGLDKIVHGVIDGTPLMLIAIAVIWFAISMLAFMSVFRLIDRLSLRRPVCVPKTKSVLMGPVHHTRSLGLHCHHVRV